MNTKYRHKYVTIYLALQPCLIDVEDISNYYYYGKNKEILRDFDF